MLLTIDFASAEPIYMQIRSRIVEGIASGELRDGAPLPSVRTLAAEAGVNLHTVGKAYGLLRSEGFIEMLRGRGAIVRAGDTAKNTAAFLETTDGALRGIVSEASARGVDRAVIHKIIDQLFDEMGGDRS